MAQRFWVGGTGSWNQTTHWSTASGGSSGASVPTSADDAIFDANSGSNATATTTLGATCNNLDLSGWDSLSQISLFSGFSLIVNGNVTLPTAGSGFAPITGGDASPLFLSGTAKTVTSNAKRFAVTITVNGTYQQTDTFNATGQKFNDQGSWTTNSNVMTVGALSVSSGTSVLALGTTTVTIDGYKGTVFSVQGSTSITGTGRIEMTLQTQPNASSGGVFPTVIDLNNATMTNLYLTIDYVAGRNDTYTSNQYIKFNSACTISQLDVGAGVFMKGVAGITLTATNCNILGTSALPCSLISETGGSQFSLCVTNSNVTWTTFKDVNASCSAINDSHGSCTSNCTNLTFSNPAAQVKGAALMALL